MHHPSTQAANPGLSGWGFRWRWPRTAPLPLPNDWRLDGTHNKTVKAGQKVGNKLAQKVAMNLTCGQRTCYLYNLNISLHPVTTLNGIVYKLFYSCLHYSSSWHPTLKYFIFLLNSSGLILTRDISTEQGPFVKSLTVLQTRLRPWISLNSTSKWTELSEPGTELIEHFKIGGQPLKEFSRQTGD